MNSISLCVWHVNLDRFHSTSVSVFSVAFNSFQLNAAEKCLMGMTVKIDNVPKQVTGLLLPRNVTHDNHIKSRKLNYKVTNSGKIISSVAEKHDYHVLKQGISTFFPFFNHGKIAVYLPA